MLLFPLSVPLRDVVCALRHRSQIREVLLKKKEKLVALLRSLCARIPRKMMTAVGAKFQEIEKVGSCRTVRLLWHCPHFPAPLTCCGKTVCVHAQLSSPPHVQSTACLVECSMR